MYAIKIKEGHDPSNFAVNQDLFIISCLNLTILLSLFHLFAVLFANKGYHILNSLMPNIHSRNVLACRSKNLSGSDAVSLQVILFPADYILSLAWPLL